MFGAGHRWLIVLTVQAEVYFKGLVGEVQRRERVRRETLEAGRGGGVRVVEGGAE